MTMVSDFPDKVKGFLLNPVETIQQHREEEFGDAFKYFLMILAINAILSGILIMAGFGAAFAGMGGAGAGFIIAIIGGFIGGIIGLFIIGIILHIFVTIVGGQRGLMETLKAVIYASTPSMLLGWIPVINFIAGIWALVLAILAIRELQDIPTVKAAIAVLLPFIILIILSILLVGFLTIGAVSTMQYY
ncbi:hypothetical protein F1737_10860 [Methanoplanus sp. FWC-SCC4]|uniref:Yip1 domain-containing protein n=1 Tax=Methanochimaera problematica TaxID=2609417 RepID=A0AA97FE16_9EURY|nr:Yip1 family protein [Methanoplanus sp. FWC-SCC4]WOF17142.1 hypothetical protein F1737_10860 [Methanoplanus sp. FWC-SCC4]